MSGPVGASQWMYSSGEFGIGDSLRFEDGSNSYLSWTPASAGNTTTYTVSFWIKGFDLREQTILSAENGAAQTFIKLRSDGQIQFGAWNGSSYDFNLRTTALHRDPSAFYHIVCVMDGGNATSSDRQRIYVNGERRTSFTHETYTASGQEINTAVTHYLGRLPAAGSTQYLSALLADVYFIDGQALDPTSFGETVDGYWRPVAYSGSYGANGFHLEFGGAVTDSSGNGNDWTANNISAHDYMPDTPTNNFAVLNAVDKGSAVTLSEGNLAATLVADDAVRSTFHFDIDGSQSWYAEMYVSGTPNSSSGIGIVTSTASMDASGGNAETYWYFANGNKRNVTEVAYGASYTAGDVIGVGVSGGAVTFYKNGVSQGSAFTGLSGSFAFAVAEFNGTSTKFIYNFGQDSTFAGATTAGGNTDANGIGDFKYAPPTGYLALCTSNLPTPTIVDGSQHFVSYLYTADGTSPKSRTGIGFTPDFLWFKDRTTAFSHALYDTVRGTNKGLQSNSTNAENSYTLLTSFDADGFTTTNDGTVGNLLNNSTDAYVTWAWKAGGSAVSNTDGSITSQVSANTDMGFSVCTYTGDGGYPTSFGHGLGVAPDMVIVKGRDVAYPWMVYHRSLPSALYYLRLNETNAQATHSGMWDGSANPDGPTSSVVNLGTHIWTNSSGNDYVAYCFANSDIIKCGKYVGNGSSDGPMVFTGGRPAFVLLKKSSAAGDNWSMYDNKRDIDNTVREYLIPNDSQAAGATDTMDFVSNGFKVRNSGAYINTSGATYIYLAIMETPLKNATAR